MPGSNLAWLALRIRKEWLLVPAHGLPRKMLLKLIINYLINQILLLDAYWEKLRNLGDKWERWSASRTTSWSLGLMAESYQKEEAFRRQNQQEQWAGFTKVCNISPDESLELQEGHGYLESLMPFLLSIYINEVFSLGLVSRTDMTKWNKTCARDHLLKTRPQRFGFIFLSAHWQFHWFVFKVSSMGKCLEKNWTLHYVFINSSTPRETSAG